MLQFTETISKLTSNEVKPNRTHPDSNQHIAEKSNVRRLAYLDGLRGIGCILVYMLHYEVSTHTWAERSIMESAYGYDGHYSYAALPFVRLLFVGGHPAVTVFFVMSGYVCSARCLQAIHDGDTAKIFRLLRTAIFRRWLRLYLPVLATTFLFMLSWHVLSLPMHQEVQATLWEEIRKWASELAIQSFAWGSKMFNTYNFHTWTIPIEFKGSMVLYFTLLVLCRTPTWKRLIFEVVAIFYFSCVVDGWYGSLFMAGLLLCEIDLLIEKQMLPPLLARLQKAPQWVMPLLFLLGLYFGGMPCHRGEAEYMRKQPGWAWLASLKPPGLLDVRWLYRGLSGILIVFTVPRIPLVRSLFESRFAQYMGKISFGFYLVHGPVLYTVADRLFAASGRIREHYASMIPAYINVLPLPSKGPLGLEPNFVVPHLIIFPITVWLGDLITRFIDNPTLRFCRWLELQLLDDSKAESKISAEHLA